MALKTQQAINRFRFAVTLLSFLLLSFAHSVFSVPLWQIFLFSAQNSTWRPPCRTPPAPVCSLVRCLWKIANPVREPAERWLHAPIVRGKLHWPAIAAPEQRLHT